jgi:DNA polymerase-3 subunit delta'
VSEVLPWHGAPLQQALRQRAHALLVHGQSGLGQLEFGLAFARASLCEAEAAERPCGRCAGCRLMETRAHPDFHLLVPEALRVALGWIDAAEDGDGSKARKPSREIRVEAVRDAIAWAQNTPSRGRGKLVLIHPAQAMNAVTANALLKTLEEPPASLRLVLTATDPELLLPTIRSRCQRLRLPAPDRAQALAWLQGQGIEGAEVLLTAADGRPLDVVELVRDGFDAGRWAALPRSIARGDAAALAGLPLPRVVETLHKLCHDAMARAAGGTPRYFDASVLPPTGPLPPLAAWSRSLAALARNEEHPWNAGLLMDALVIEAQRALVPAPAAAGRLDRMRS